jgi:CheY-like chemotaxis protein
VLLNLLSNALEFTDRGEIGLDIQRLPDGNHDARLRFAVHDSGVGIEAAQLEIIFQPFEQVGELPRRAGGTGLGLAISRQLARLMGGEIQVESTPGRGSRFWFELSAPIAEPTATVPRERRAVVAYLGPPRRVLVVDDVPANRAVLTDLLTSVGFMVHEAADGQQARDQAQALRPDLIVLDVMLPVLDGLAVTRRKVRPGPLAPNDCPWMDGSTSTGERTPAAQARVLVMDE